jgi:peroxiredoxin Q/BCP
MVLALIVAYAANKYYANHPAPNHTMAPTTSASRVLHEGDLAPDFTLPDAHGENKVTLSKLVEKGPVLMIYYLGYNCPRCVAHLVRLDDRKGEYHQLGTQIIAVSPSTVTETQDSIEVYGDFPFPMLCDDEMKVANAYGLIHGETLFHGAYIIDTDRRIRFAMQSSHPYDDDEKLLATLKQLRN